MTTANKTAPAPSKSRSLEQMSTGRGGHFNFTFAQLTIPDGYNPRKEFHGIPELAESILAEGGRKTKDGQTIAGLLNPLRVRKIEGTEIIEVLDGERRYRAIGHLISQGNDVGLIPCIPEQQHTTELQRDLVPLVANTGQELTFLEKARQYQRIIDRHQITPAELARRCQTTKQAVSDALRLTNEASNLLLSYVSGGKMSATTALLIIKQADGYPEEQDRIALAAEKASESADADHITPKHIVTTPSTKSSPSIQSPTEPESPTDHPALITDHSPAKPVFTLYRITNVPTEAFSDNSYHETERLALANPPNGISLLHLLSFVHEDGTMLYGFRLNDTTAYPGENDDLDGHLPDQGYRLALDAAFETIVHPPEEISAITEALFDSLCTYYPGDGDPTAEPETLPFVDTLTPETGAETTGYKGILNAGSTNRDGSSTGTGGGTSYSAPDKQMEKIEALLDDLEQKDKGDPARITTTEVILSFLRNERDTKSLRTHLEGK